MDLPLEDWLGQFDEKVSDSPRYIRSEIAILLGELREFRRRGITAEYYRARREAIVQRFYERYTGKNPLTEDLLAERRKTLGIIGVQVGFTVEAGSTPKLRVIEGLPAEKFGIKTGDELVAVNGQDVSTMNHAEVTRKMVGAPGEIISLRIRSSLNGEEVVHEIERVDSDEVLPGGNVRMQ